MRCTSVEVFAGGVGDVFSGTNVVKGTAHYSGPAAGKYVTKTVTAGALTDAGVGHFTARASLMAKYWRCSHCRRNHQRFRVWLRA